MKVRFFQGITEVVTPSMETCLAFLYNAGLKPSGEQWVGNGKVGQIIRKDGNYVGAFWYPFEREMWEKICGKE